MGIHIPDFFVGGVVTHKRTNKWYLVKELRDSGDIRVRLMAGFRDRDGNYNENGWWADSKDFY